MGKSGDLWDDSALINAFDDAISTYKKMHGIAQLDSSKAGEQDANGTGEDLSNSVDENTDSKRQAEEDTNKDVLSHSKLDIEETSNGLPSEENQRNSSYVQDEQNAHQGYPKTQDAEDYNQLLNRYNEIEEQRQKVMQQLEHFNYWNVQEPGPSLQWGTWGSQQYPVMPGQINHPLHFPVPTNQVPTNQPNHPSIDPPCHPVVTNQVNHPAVAPPCCPIATNQPNHLITAPTYDPYVNQCLVAPCYLGGTCTSGSSGLACNGLSTFIDDSNVTKAALTAAEKAISALKIKNPGKPEDVREGQSEASAAGETDLNVVFNAWYTAGFYTGKYLAEHSIAKKH